MAWDALYLSPHPDDAVFSAGGAIALDVRAGRRVAIVTIFSDGAGGDARAVEDLAATALLGVARIDLRLRDAQRRGGCDGVGARLFAPLAPGDAAIVAEARAKILPLTDGAQLVAPLGAGRHVDHQIVHAAAATLPGVRFYEDLPYAFCAPLLARRIAELSGRAASRTVGDLREIARWWRARPFFRGVAPGPFRPFAAALVAWRETRPQQLPDCTPLTGERIAIDPVLDEKLAAIAAYRSQWPAFFPTLDEWRIALRTHGERQWRRAL